MKPHVLKLIASESSEETRQGCNACEAALTKLQASTDSNSSLIFTLSLTMCSILEQTKYLKLKGDQLERIH